MKKKVVEEILKYETNGSLTISELEKIANKFSITMLDVMIICKNRK